MLQRTGGPTENYVTLQKLPTDMRHGEEVVLSLLWSQEKLLRQNKHTRTRVHTHTDADHVKPWWRELYYSPLPWIQPPLSTNTAPLPTGMAPSSQGYRLLLPCVDLVIH